MRESTRLVIDIVVPCIAPVIAQLIYKVLMHNKKSKKKTEEKRERKIDMAPRSWTIWTAILTVSVIFVVVLAETRWAIPEGHCFRWIILFLLISLAATWLIALLSYKKGKVGRETAICGGILLLTLTGYLIDRALPHYVAVNCSSFVGDTAIIRGHTAHWGKWHVRVLLHPLKCEEWFVHQIPVPDASGRWQIEGIFGGTSQERFEILAIASRDDIPLELGQAIPPEEIPREVYKSRICEVEKQ